MPAFDPHQHLWPEALIRGLQTRRERPRLRGNLLELPSGDWEADLAAHRLETRLAALDRDEIDIAVVSCPPTLELDEDLVEAYHEGIAELVLEAGGRLRAFSCGSVREGFAGVCVSAWDLAELAALSPLFEDLARNGGLLFVHPGPAATPEHAPPWWAAVVDYTSQMHCAYAAWLVRAADAWPSVNVLFAILAGGAPFQLERLASRGVDTRGVLHPNAYFDTASYGERALELALAVYGVGQLVYGSDTPVVDPGPGLQSVRSFGQAVADALLEGNPARILR